MDSQPFELLWILKKICRKNTRQTYYIQFNIYGYTYIWHRFHFLSNTFHLLSKILICWKYFLAKNNKKVKNPVIQAKFIMRFLHNEICDSRKQWFAEIGCSASYAVGVFLACIELCTGRYKFIVLRIRVKLLAECILIKSEVLNWQSMSCPNNHHQFLLLHRGSV